MSHTEQSLKVAAALLGISNKGNIQEIARLCLKLDIPEITKCKTCSHAPAIAMLNNKLYIRCSNKQCVFHVNMSTPEMWARRPVC